jgi:hypothetical protein
MPKQIWALFAIVVASGGAAMAQGMPRDESPTQNVRESQQYEQLLCRNPGFRAQRIQKECSSLNDPQLHASCVASFNCNPAAARGGGDEPPAPARHRRRHRTPQPNPQ